MSNRSTRRREWIVVLAFTILGAVLRLWAAERLGLEHFDEGIYALAGLWVLEPVGLPRFEPELIPYAPPGFPMLVGLAYWLTFPFPGVSDFSAISPALLCGIATIPVVGWLGRRTFGPGAGAAAAALAAASGPHVAFSRMALTDVPFLLVWLVAMGLGARFLEQPRLGRAIVLGLAVGVAQNLKYNGWLAGGIVALAVGLMLVAGPDHRRRAAWRVIGLGLLAAAVAALVYWPWYRFIEAHGGNAALLRHHRSYVGTLSTWPARWKLQMDEMVALSGQLWRPLSWGAIAWTLAWVGCAISANGPRLVNRRAGAPWARLGIGLLVGTLVLGFLPNLPWWIGLGWLPWLLREDWPAVRLLGSWWLLMSVLTPLYHPYARLWLPVQAAGWLLLAGFLVKLGPFLNETAAADTPKPIARWPFRLTLGMGIGAVCLALALWQRGPIAADRFGAPRLWPFPDLLAPTDSLRKAITAAQPLLQTTAPGLIVLARPPVLFYLALQGVPVRRVSSLDDLLRRAAPGELVLIDRVQLEQEENSRRSSQLDQRFEVVTIFPYQLPPTTLLDVDPAAAYGPEKHAQGRTALLLLRVR
ncbi:MAG: glycosyltransferase family 39 protein [Isosphaeraceae bacterium]|nr:glycosyltransferase family 39 protein [Isosphaeraceae bacterium]